MLTVIFQTQNDEDGLARSLSSLVSGAVEGFVREVIVCDLASSDHTHKVADHAGCVFIANGDMAAALRRAKGEWIVLLEPGARLLDGWMEPVGLHVSRLTSPARFSLSREDRPGFFARFLSARRPLSNGLVITKRQALALSKNAADFGALARGLSARTLSAKLAPPPARGKD
ncbi:MAG: glycosyl transferase family 2 [Notoacmeibacter sp.]|nr:glycosyl transferase family 2 [Notoacmeibacter sp.]MCC0032046.1 glycosyl transferase family 2 [Brucellaceae bacterium]